MDTTHTEETILKADVLGRVKTPLARREQLLEEYERSGLSGQKFAAVVGIKYSTFATWVQKWRRARGAYPVKAPARRADPVKWLEAVVEAAQPSGGKNPLALVLELPGGVKAEIRDAKQVALAAELLRALAKPC
jgi:transposase-like protein